MLSALTGCNDPPVESAAPTPRVKVFVVGKKALGQSRRMSGKVQAADQSKLSFGVSGNVAEIFVETGQAVTEGQLLARLDPEPLRLSLEKLRASVTTARAKRVDAQSEFERMRNLIKQQGASQREVDAATSALGAADGDLNGTLRSLEQAELDVARTKLTAPFDGRIVEVSVDPFEEVAASGQAFLLQANGALEVEVRVPETLIRNVDFGQVVQVEFPSIEGVDVKGVVATIGAESESGNAFPVTVRLASTEADIRPGMTASVTFNFNAYLDGRNAYLIPISALAIDAGLREAAATGTPEQAGPGSEVPVFVLDPATGTVGLRQVTVGDIRGNELEVFEGLQPGDQVVAAGVSFLRDGMEAQAWKLDGENGR